MGGLTLRATNGRLLGPANKTAQAVHDHRKRRRPIRRVPSGGPAATRPAALPTKNSQAENPALHHPLLVAVTLVLVALNLRPALSSLAPVMGDVVRDAGLSSGQAGLLTTSPVLCLGLFGVIAPRLAQRFGTERTIFFTLLVLGFGVALRGSAISPHCSQGRRWRVRGSASSAFFCPPS